MAKIYNHSLISTTHKNPLPKKRSVYWFSGLSVSLCRHSIEETRPLKERCTFEKRRIDVLNWGKKKHSNKPVHKPTVWNYLNLILLLLIGEITRQSIHCPTSNTIIHKKKNTHTHTHTHTHCRGNDFSLVLSPTSFSANGYVGKPSKVPSQTLFCTLSLQIQKGTAHACNRKFGEKREIEKKVVTNCRFFLLVCCPQSRRPI